MNIQKILDENPENYAYKILKPHKRTIHQYYPRKHQKTIQFIHPLLFLAKINYINKFYQLQALYPLIVSKNNYYKLIYTSMMPKISESCMPVNFYEKLFENKDDCLNQAINAFFNSTFPYGQILLENPKEQIKTINEPLFRKNHLG